MKKKGAGLGFLFKRWTDITRISCRGFSKFRHFEDVRALKKKKKTNAPHKRVRVTQKTKGQHTVECATAWNDGAQPNV